jgi:hypothetical protein
LIWTGDKQQGSISTGRTTGKTNAAPELINKNYLGEEKIPQISKLLELFGKYLPADIKRHDRSLTYLSKWKATECRLFALYTGPVALKGVIADELYSHFLYYHGAINMLSSPNSF